MSHGFVAAICFLLAAAGCAQSDGGAAGTVFDGDGFRVRVPVGWQAEATDPAAWRGHQTIALISNQALDPQCDGADATDCRAPVAALDDGSLLVWWVTTNCAGASCQLPEGERLLIGGREGRRIERTGLCDDLAATSETTYVVTVSPQRLDAVITCGNDAPQSAADELQSLLDSIDWRTP